MIRRLSAALRRDRAGTALVEFAVVLPVMLTLYLGGYQLSDAIACNRKVTITTRAVADLTSQYAILAGSDVDKILAASTQIMSPYSASNAKLRVSQIYNDSNKVTKVNWSRGQNWTARSKNSTVTLPTDLQKYTNAYLILAEVNYTYTPAFGTGFMPTKTLTQTIYMVPRVSTSISCDTCQS